jgi:DNA topoisomerase-6 subunit B
MAKKKTAGTKAEKTQARKSKQTSSASKSKAKPASPKPKTTQTAGKKASPAKKSRRRKTSGYATAESMAASQRSISVSEFFAKNRHLLGFDNPRKALLTTVKEAVDNSLDACEEAGINPEVRIAIEQLAQTHYRVTIEDNGPGIVKKQIPNIFGRLLYGSKFHRLRMSRGQQGIGISAAGMYGLLTTGKSVCIVSRTSPRAEAHYYELQIDTKKNKPAVITDETTRWDVDHGTRVSIELEAKYLRGRQSVDDYLQQTAIANPHVTLHYQAPDGRAEHYPASVEKLPPTPRQIKPHPHGIELGVLIKMLQDTKAKTLQQFLTGEFSRVSPRVAGQVIELAGFTSRSRPRRLGGDDARKIYDALNEVKILSPSTDCVVPIGQEQLIAGLKTVVDAAFYTAVTRKPSVYRGNPFVIEAAIAYGKPEKTEKDKDTPGESRVTRKACDEDESPQAKLIRFANRVPLQYQQGACVTSKAVAGMNWRGYGLNQPKGSMPQGDLTIVVHMGSVWVPFTSESKEAIASYPEILKEIRLALQECGRKLGTHIRKHVRMKQELKKRSYIQKYIPAIGEALQDILALDDKQVDSVCDDLKGVLERSRKI